MSNDTVNARLPRELEVTEDGMAIKWKLWKQTFDFYAIATQLSTKSKEVKAATFMSAIGPAATVIFNTFDLNEADSKDLAKITERFDAHFSPKPNETYTRYLFFNQMQGKLETFDSYVTKLKTKVSDCSFGTLQDSLIRDQIVRGICSDKVRELLLAERDLTLQKAVDICRASEQATNQLKEMHSVTISNEKEILAVRKMKTEQSGYNVHKKKFDSYIQNKSCWRCGLTHEFKNCPAFNVICKVCSEKGHYARQCRAKSKQNLESRNFYSKKIHELNEDSDEDLNCDSLHIGELINFDNKNAWFTSVKFNDYFRVKFKLDTGAEGNVITKDVVNKLSLPISKTSVQRLKSFNNQYTLVLGEVKTECTVENKPVNLKFLVVDGNYNCILGCKTCDNLGLIKRNVNVLQLSEISADIPKEIFEGIGCIKNFEYDIEFDDNVTFSIHPPRRIPYALRDTVKKEIDLMVKMNILKPVTQPTPAVSPLVIVKSGDRVRLCLDPTDINKVIKRRHFPLKTVEDIAARIGKAKFFTLLDAKKGFWQLRVSKRTSEYLTMNTPWGRFSFLRVPFGLASAPEIFQQVMQGILKDFQNVECSMDDILLWANTEEEMMILTQKVIKRLFNCGVRLNKEKCKFSKPEVKFLGHLFTSDGIEIDPSKVTAITLLRTPTCLSELQRFIGMVNYVSKFVPNYSAISEPLRRLLQKNVLWDWSKDQEEAFGKLKEALKNAPKLAFYDVNKPVVVSVDASSHAMGAVLLQEGRPIAYSTKALTPTQKRYPQIEKEALAIRYGCKKFHDYIYGKSVVIETDHKPLESIFKKPLQLAPPRLQRLLFDVLQYSPMIVYIRGKDIPIPDALSRDCEIDSLENSLAEEIFEITVDVPFPISLYPEMLSAVNEDEELQQLKSLILNGWPAIVQKVPQELRKYWNYRDELSVYENLLFKSERLIIPRNLQNQYLMLIHQGHLGTNLSLRRAREIVFWHGMSQDIVNYVQQCPVCQQTSRAPNTEPLLMKPVPCFPWQRVASDLFEFKGKTYCLVADSYSGYFDLKELHHPTSHAVIEFLKDCFAIHGIPDILESDNGPTYYSEAFRQFTRSWKIKHITSSPHYPKSNGLAERYVQEAKLLLQRSSIEKIDYRLSLLNWRNTPRNNLTSPVKRLFGRPTRTLIPIHPSQRLQRESSSIPLQMVREKQRLSSTSSGAHSPLFVEGEKVKLRISPRNWVPAAISGTVDAPRSYLVTTTDGSTFRRNSGVIRKTKADIPPHREIVVHPSPQRVIPKDPGPITPSAQISLRPVADSTSSVIDNSYNTNKQSQTMTTRSGRIVRPPERLDL